MSEPNEPAAGAPESAVQPPNSDGQSSGGGEPKTFSAEYVGKLRDEAAGYRVKAARAEDLAQALYDSARQLATAGILRDPADLPDGDYEDPETGRPDLHKMRGPPKRSRRRSRTWLCRACRASSCRG